MQVYDTPIDHKFSLDSEKYKNHMLKTHIKHTNSIKTFFVSLSWTCEKQFDTQFDITQR